MIKSYIAILFMFLCSNFIGAQSVSEYTFRPIGVSQGLPDNYVKTVFGLPDGRLGVRTTILLSLYDGNNFKNFSLLGGEVYSLEYICQIPTQYIDRSDRLWIKDRDHLQVFDLNTEKFISPAEVFRSLGVDDKVSDFFVDSEGIIWIVTSDKSLYCLYPGNESVTNVYSEDAFVENNGRLFVLDTYSGFTWMVHENGVLRCYDSNLKKFIRQEKFLEGRIGNKDNVRIKLLENGDFWLLYSHGLAYYNSSVKEWTDINLGMLGDYQELVAIDTDKSGNAWVGSVRKGLFIVNRFTNDIQPCSVLSYSATDSFDNVHSVYIDKTTNIIWIGLFNRGLAYYHPSMGNFRVYNSKSVSGGWANSDIHCMTEMNNSSLLLGTDNGLCLYNFKSNTITYPYPQTSGILCKSIVRDKMDNLWLGTYQNGIFRIDGNSISNIKHITLPEHKGYETNGIRCLAVDSDNNIWASFYGGVGKLAADFSDVDILSERHPELKKYRLANTMLVSRSGKLVVGTDNGLYFYDIKNDEIIIPQYKDINSSGVTLDNNKYNCMLEDSHNMLWLGTQYGLFILDRAGNMHYLGEEHGLENATIQSIQEDNNHDIWISTISSIYKIVVNKKEDSSVDFRIVCLEWSNRKEYSDLYEFCSLKLHSGELIFGRIDGFCRFVPENIVLTSCKTLPFFTSFKLFNKVISSGEIFNDRILFNEIVNKNRKVTLDYDENFVTIEFSSLNFLHPSQTHFRYRLDGADKEWTQIVSGNSNGSVTYNNLHPGKYVFRLQSAGNDYVWSPESLFYITVSPPLWETWPAFILYFIVFAMAVWGVLIYLRKKNIRRIVRMQEEESIRQKEELNQMKFRFFTNISHELRTPLTLIMTPLEVLMKKDNDEKTMRQLSVIHKNATDLYNLVNQLLDFRKSEMRMEKLHLSSGNIRDFINSIYTCFLPFAEEKHLKFTIENLPAAKHIYFDHDKMHKILNNLLSNAFKFTHENGSVLLKINEILIGGRNMLSISVEDTGVGMSEEDIKHIFERFYQSSNNAEGTVGSGIGLHLVKEYVRMHQGEIEVESKQDEGTIFRLLIPMDLKPAGENAHENNETTGDAPEEHTQLQEDTKLKILVVEDNNDMRAFLAEQLEEQHTVFTAADGEEGYKLAQEHNPDLIVSDIMMPKVDGIELCRMIKTNVQTSHIPVILLSARTADNVKISGYEVGADSYISKPFNFELLLVRIKKLIEQQEDRRKEFKKNISVDPSAITITSLDEQLVKKALELIEKNMDNTSYSVESLSSDMGMSRMNLYRKIQSITGQTPTEFIRSIRLKRAAQILSADNKLSMAEVADMVGFSSSSYFTKCFKEQFGVLPTQYAAEHQG